jgi:hypothetical protein
MPSRPRRAPRPKDGAVRGAIDWSRYAGQLRPWTPQDAVTQHEIDWQLNEDLQRAATKEQARRRGDGAEA